MKIIWDELGRKGTMWDELEQKEMMWDKRERSLKK